jgi:hypothetical protein
MGKNGGLRPNAGRKKANHTIAAEAGRAFIVRFVEEQRAKILQAQLDLALGHYEAEEQKDGTQRVYFKAPDGKAGEYLLNQAYGKPKETTEHSGLDGQPITFEWLKSPSSTDQGAGPKPSTTPQSAG